MRLPLLFLPSLGLAAAVCHGFAASTRAPDAASPPRGLKLLLAGPQASTSQRDTGTLLPADPPASEDVTRLQLPSPQGKPKIAYSFNPDDDLAAIRRAGFTHVLISYLQGAPDAEQLHKLDECRRHGLKVIYRLVDLVDHDRRAGGDAGTQHAVILLRDHLALAAWQTFEETNLPTEPQIAVYRKIKQWDPRHPVITVITNEYSLGWYQRTYSDEAQDVVMIDYYPYKRGYDGWIYIPASMAALRAVQKRPVPIIPVIQASSAAHVASAENTIWPPPGGLEKQLNLWWSLGADAGVAFWVWRGSKGFPFVGIADQEAPPYALPETTALLARIPDGDLPSHTPAARVPADVIHPRRGYPQAPAGKAAFTGAWRLRVPAPRVYGAFHGEIPAVRVWQPRVNYLKNSGFERGLEGWVGYNEIASVTDQAYAGRHAARMANGGPPKAIGIGQPADLLVPPNTTVTVSCYYKVVREATSLQWMVNTTAYPKFGAAEFLERKERLPPGDWRRATISVTNTTGAPQRVTGVSVISNRFTGEVLLDNFQLELAPQASAYTDRGPQVDLVEDERQARPHVTRLRFDLPFPRPGRPAQAHRRRSERRARTAGIRMRGKGKTAVLSSLGPEWTLTAWSAPEAPPAGDSYACLAALACVPGYPAKPGVPARGHRGLSLELRLRVDPQRSDRNGWAGALEVAAGGRPSLRMPIALAPGQPVFWALSGDRGGHLTLRAAPAGYRLESLSARAAAPSTPRALFLGADAAGGHPLNGLVAASQFVPRALPLQAVDRIYTSAGR